MIGRMLEKQLNRYFFMWALVVKNQHAFDSPGSEFLIHLSNLTVTYTKKSEKILYSMMDPMIRGVVWK